MISRIVEVSKAEGLTWRHGHSFKSWLRVWLRVVGLWFPTAEKIILQFVCPSNNDQIPNRRPDQQPKPGRSNRPRATGLVVSCWSLVSHGRENNLTICLPFKQ